jgi:hypothetical protein
MSLIVSNSPSQNNSGKIELPSEGPHPATLVKVKDLGDVETKFGPKHRVRFIWQVEDERDARGNPKMAFQAFNVSFDAKSFLYKAVRQILGAAPPSTFDLESLVGTEATIVVEHNVGNDGITYANISAVIRGKAVRS